jgi:hypothetical protein
MNETTRRQMSIAKELMTWVCAMPRLISRIDEVVCLPNITSGQKLEVELIRHRIEDLFRNLHASVEADEGCERLTASMDRIREEIAAADDKLDRLFILN